MARWAPDDPALLIRQYQDGLSTYALGQIYGVSYVTIARALSDAGCELRTSFNRTGRRPWAPPDMRALVKRYRAGATLDALAREHGVNPQTVRFALVRAGVTIRPKHWRATPALFQAYHEGASLADLAAEYKVQPNTVAKALRHAGVQIRPAGEQQIWQPPADLADRYAAGASVNALSSIEGVANGTITRALQAQGVPLRPSGSRWMGPRDLARRYQAGASIAALAREFGKSPTTVAYALRRRGATIRPPALRKVRFGRLIDDFIADQYAYGRFTSKETEKAYRRTLELHADDVGNGDPALVTPDDVMHMLKRFPVASMRKHRSILVSFYRWMVETRRRTDNPAEQTPRPRAKRTQVYRLTRAEVAAMLAEASSLHERRIVALGALAGLRNREMRGLQRRHFERPGFVHVDEQIAKGGVERWVPVLPELEPIVAEIVTSVQPEHYVLPGVSARRCQGPGGQRPAELVPTRSCSPQHVNRVVHEVAERAGIRHPIHTHLLRHAFGDHIARQLPLRHTSEIMGHASSQTTETYYLGRLSPDDLASVTRGLVLYGEARPVRRVA